MFGPFLIPFIDERGNFEGNAPYCHENTSTPIISMIALIVFF